MHIHWCFILKYIFVLYVLRICENSDSTKYKWKKTAHNKHILFIHTWWYHVRWLTARRRWPSVSISHTLTVGLWGWYEWQPKQSNWERERDSKGERLEARGWSKRWLWTCEMWGECAIINFHIQPCQPASAIATYKVLQTSRTQTFSHTYITPWWLHVTTEYRNSFRFKQF